MKYRIGLETAACVLVAAVWLTPALQARQCSGSGDIVGSYGFTASRSGFYLLGATAAGAGVPSGAGLMIPVPATPPGTSGSTGTTTPFVGSNTNIGNLLTGLVNPEVFASVGRVFADGMGNLYASPTVGLMTNILAGSYNVSTNCSITMTLTDPFATNTPTPGVTTTTAAPVTLTGFVSANGAELDMNGANGAVVKFMRTSQAGNCSNSYLSGDFTISGNGFYLVSASNGQTVTGTTPGQTTPGTTTGPCLNSQTGTTAGTTTGTTAQSGSCTGAFTPGVTGFLGTPFNLLGRFVADGSGMLTTDFSGQQSPGQSVTGTYAVNADCTGTAHLVDAAGIARNISFVLVNQAAQCYIGASPQGSARQQLDFVFSDPGVIGSGTAQLQ
jgi:hypothetical protein